MASMSSAAANFRPGHKPTPAPSTATRPTVPGASGSKSPPVLGTVVTCTEAPSLEVIEAPSLQAYGSCSCPLGVVLVTDVRTLECCSAAA
eukprot:3978495-Prymnesium_polylepis.1